MTQGPLTIVQASTDKRPEIKVTLELARVTEEAIGALASDGEVFHRGGILVHVVRAFEAPGARRRAETPIIRELPVATLRVRLAACARWLRFDGKNWERCNAPDSIVQAVHTRGQWGGVRPLVGVITSPTLRPDGSILQEAGYDKSTGLLFWPSARFAPIAESPTKEDAEVATRALLDLVSDFPFATEADRSAWLAGVLTILSRHAVSGPVPLFAVDGTTRGSGKSKLVDVAVSLACGHDAARSSLAGPDEEQRKQITSLLLQGDPVILIDNVSSSRKLGGPSLDAVLTSNVWRDRLLGKTSVLTVPARAVWWATGNNLGFAGDLARRSLRIRLASPLENPEARSDFRHPDLVAYVLRERARLVAHALTILRAYHVAGRPWAEGHAWGSFEAWTRLVVGAVRWVGEACPLAARATEDEWADEERLHAAAILAALEDMGRDGAGPFSAREVIDALFPREEEHGPAPDRYPSYAAGRAALEAATSARGVPSTHQVGLFLRRIRERVVDGRRLVATLDPRIKIQRWHAARVGS